MSHRETERSDHGHGRNEKSTTSKTWEREGLILSQFIDCDFFLCSSVSSFPLFIHGCFRWAFANHASSVRFQRPEGLRLAGPADRRIIDPLDDPVPLVQDHNLRLMQRQFLRLKLGKRHHDDAVAHRA